jgi:hypothetical protein
VALGAMAVAAVLAGCTTTMQEAARVQLNSARIRASELSTRVTVAGRALRVTRVALISDHGTTAFVVKVRNASAAQRGDVPISVGVRIAHKPPIYLNAQSGREYFYFDAHLPVVRPGRTLTWVYTLHRRLPAAARPFAIVGRRPSPPVPAVGDLPVVEATTLGAKRPEAAGARTRPASSTRLKVVVHNLSAIPQYQLQVYAVARRGSRYVAAGSLTIAQLDGQTRRTFELGLVGSAEGARLELEALPTTLR